MKKKICLIMMSLVILSGCSLLTSCASSGYDDSGMYRSKSKKSQKIRNNYKVKGYGDSGKQKK